MTTRRTLLALFLAGALLDGCACERLPSTALTDCTQGAVVQGAVKTDILFVIDDSASMSEEQTNLQTNLNAFISALKASPVAIDFQIGVTTTAVGTFGGGLTGLQGALITNVPAGTPAVLTGDRPDLVNEFSTRVVVGTSGSGKEQPLRAMKLALTSPLIDAGNANAGFLRPGARLAVVFLTDEDDNSETLTNVANTNDRTHNDAGDGVDYKFGVEDPVADYLGFLAGPIGGEVREVVIGAIVPIDATTGLPTCGNTADGWCCGGTLNATTCDANPAVCGSYTHTVTGTSSSVTSSTYCCGGTGGACTSTCPTAYDKADRFAALLDGIPAGHKLGGSVCDSSFAATLELIAGVIISPTVPLSGEPADPALLVVQIVKPDGTVVSCTAGTDYTYAPASGSKPASVTFLDSGACKLDRGYEIKIDVICAG